MKMIHAALAAWAVFAAIGAAAAQEITVRETEIDDRKAVYATVESADRIAARARIEGTISRLAVDEGSAVVKDQVIADVVDPKLDSRRAALEARIQSLESRRKLARTVLERVTKLYQSGSAAQSRLDEATTEVNVIERDLAALGAERRIILQQLAEGAVLAPAGGRVVKVPVTAGAVVMSGETIAIIAANAYVLRLYLPERHARFLRVGDHVLVGQAGLDPAAPTSELRSGVIAHVYPELRQGRVVADIEVSGIGDYFIGERVAVHVVTGRRKTFVVPADYLFRRHGLTFARIKDGREVVVQAGLAVDSGVEVLSGLAAGDILVRPGAGQ